MKIPFAFFKGAAAPPYDFGSLDYTGLFFGEDYIYGTGAVGGGATSGEWPGRASIGTSGSNSLTRTANAPTVGSSSGGYTAVAFDETQHLVGAALSTFVTSNVETGWLLLKVNSVNASSDYTSPDAWQNAQVLGNASGYWGVALKKTGPLVQAWRYATATPSAAVSLATWFLVFWRRNGSSAVLELGINADALTSAASNAIGDASSALRVGGAGTAFDYHLNGEIMAFGLSKQAFSDGDRADIRGGLESHYAMSLS